MSLHFHCSTVLFMIVFTIDKKKRNFLSQCATTVLFSVFQRLSFTDNVRITLFQMFHIYYHKKMANRIGHFVS